MKIEIKSAIDDSTWGEISINIPKHKAPAMYLQELSEVMGRRFRMWSDDCSHIVYETNKGLPFIINNSPLSSPIEAIEKATEFIRNRDRAKSDMANHMLQSSLKDSGERQEFGTGAVRDVQKDKPRIDLIPPEVLVEMGIHYAQGAEKYEDRNWEKGIPIDRYVASFDRHWVAWKMGETDEPHLRAAIWNLMGIMHHEIMIRAGRLPETLIGVFGVLAREKRERSAYLKEIVGKKELYGDGHKDWGMKR